MKLAAFASLALAAFLNTASATEAASAPETTESTGAEADISSEAAVVPNAQPAVLGNFCFFAGTPASDFKYTVIRKLKVGKGTYGGVKDLLPKFAGYAQSHGADAIINYTGSQRFGFWPWRMVRPVVRGTAIKWANPAAKDCAAMGGTTLSTILASDKPPAQ